ncbi:MAG: PIG-L family deacetylase [Streptosporangiaceae bacterium]
MTHAAATAYAEAADAQRFSGRRLPRVGHLLAVTARPGQESADLGRLLYAFRRRGTSLALLSMTRGEASPLNTTCERLAAVRPWELQVAAGLLGVSSLIVADYPDGQLNRQPAAELTERVRRAIRQHATDLLVVIDPATADPDDVAVARAVCAAAEQTGVPALARMPRAARSGWHVDLGPDAAAARAVQRAALAAHASQARVRPGAQCRIDRQDDREQLRWLVPPRRMFALG